MAFKKYFASLVSAFILMSIFVSCSGPEEKAMKFFEKGQGFFEKGDYVKARLEFKNCLQVKPGFAKGYYMLGMVELREKNWKKAFGLLSKATELDENLLDAHVALGKLFVIAKQQEQAMEKAELVLGKKPDHEDALLLKASVLSVGQKDQEAEAILQSLIKKNPEKPGHTSTPAPRFRKPDP